ncbi:MAG TPA: ThiF family adenylyltransferase [Mycobacteriales bacterium]|nr:ThiF family adenylyltransferase [Mycobacteriales bacterium]
MDVSRNWGFVTAAEQERICSVKVAIAGTGGDGGLVAEHLARLGVRHFALADPERFEPENVNRQAGCDVTTIGRNKAEVIADVIRRIAPESRVDVYPDGISPECVREFVAGAAVVVDETEYTRPHLSLMLARAARPAGIPVVSGLNAGFGAMVTCFRPGGMTLERYLGLPPDITIEAASTVELPLRRWVVRLPSYGDERGLRVLASGAVSAPSVAPGVALAAGLVGTEVFNLLTGRRAPVAAPRTLVVDALEMKLRVVRFRSLAYYASLAHLVARSRLGRNPRVTPPVAVGPS